MMNNITKSQVCNVKPGTVIVGKWYKKTYKIVRSLGFGANGIVYLADSMNGPVALKISENSISITSEVNVLKHFSKVQGSTLGPSLLDVDDWIRPGFPNPISFYVMEYIQGDDLLTFVQKRGKEWAGILCLQLLSDLDRLHQEGWVFGDLKPDNLIVSGNPPQIRCIDVGGTTIQGRAIKEFTEFFDRGYWQAGSRKAEPSYDLFAVAMIIINIAYPKRFTKTDQPLQQLKKVVNNNDFLQKFDHVLLNAIDGNYQKASEMRQALLQKMSQQSKMRQVNKAQHSTQQSNSQIRTASRTKTRVVHAKPKSKKRESVFETFLLILFVSLGYLLYLYGQYL